MTTKEKTPREQWVERNPLRKWRKSEGLSLMAAAAKLGASMSALQQWEAGATTPSESSLSKLADALGTDAAKLSRSWLRWLDTMPDA